MKKISLIIFLLTIYSYAFSEEHIFSGDIYINTKTLFTNKKIVFLPNTKLFINRGLEEGLVFENCDITFLGTADNPITVEGTGPSEPQEDKNLIHIENSSVTVRFTIFKEGSWQLHIHNSKVLIENSVFERNYGGIRFSSKDVTIRKNIFKENKIGTRFIKADPTIVNNIFLKNDVAIYLREGVEQAEISFNAFIENGYDLYGGFFQEEDINIVKNYFLSEPRFFDKKKDSSLNFSINSLDTLTTFPDWH